MDNRTVSSFKKSIRDLNFYIQQLNTELFKLSLKQFTLEKILTEKGIIDNEDTTNSLKEAIKSNDSSKNVKSGGSNNATLEALSMLAKQSERSVKIINN